ncbi:olfactory receptor 10P1 [Sapajus apella]|uniref:Olfactory receptor n=1 Tax=Sapajus apella TaxID=9515 RepID=A0A6J3EWH6_SAPAP|nr:olfactory receptor 10P1 [Sapajus apella]
MIISPPWLCLRFWPGVTTGVNHTTLPEFLLLGFSDLKALQGPLFWVVLLVYLVTLLSNSLIILLTQVSPALHSPMYFFLRQLSVVELFYTTNIVPRTLANLASPHPQTISFQGCAAQMYIFIVLGISECCLLMAMAYDRYAAICQPLHYSTLLSPQACMTMVGTSWLIGIITATTHASLIFSLPFPSHPIIPHFLCDILPVLRLASAGKHRSEISVMTATVVFIMVPFSLIVTSYIRILGAILAMASTQSRRKVFSTCSSHLLVVCLFFGTASITYIRPQAGSSVTTDRILSLFYTVITPMLNPIIYTLRNKDVTRALQHLMKRQSPSP